MNVLPDSMVGTATAKGLEDVGGQRAVDTATTILHLRRQTPSTCCNGTRR